MKKIETLLKLELNCKFDTPKKLNRATANIPATIIEQLEGGLFTCEMLNELKKDFPIFFYRTCLTIHGNWGDIERTYIGGYKHIHQNGNGSIEVFYPAIDKAKIIKIREMLFSAMGYNCEFHYRENSTARTFQKREPVTKETLITQKVKFLEVANRLKELNIYGTVNVYIEPLMFGGYEIVCDFRPSAIPEIEINNLTFALLNCDAVKYSELCELKKSADLVKKAESEQREKVSTSIRNIMRRKHERIINTIYLPQIANLEECNELTKGILVAVNSYTKYQDANGNYLRHSIGAYRFIYYRFDGKGSFNKLKVSKAYSDTFINDTTLLSWEQLPQSKELPKIKNFRLVETAKVIDVIKPTTAPQKQVSINTLSKSVEVRYNEAKNGIELIFKSKPDAVILTALKSNGWRWSNFNKLWYNQKNQNSINFANKLI